MTDDEQFNAQLDRFAEFAYSRFCNQGFPLLDIPEASIGQYAEQLGLSKSELIAILREAAHRHLLQYKRDYEVSPLLIAWYERQHPEDDRVKANQNIRDLLYAKIAKARQTDTDIISEDDVYNDPQFSSFERKHILHNVEYLSQTEHGIELVGQDGFSIVTLP